MGVLEDIETLVASADRLNDDGVPSASIALLDSPTGQAQAHVITKGKENPDTVYQACSISKAITALGVAKLIDLGRLTYDTKVADHLSKDTWGAIVDPKTEHLMGYVTVGLLVSHRSGLSQHGFPGYASKDTPTVQQIFSGHPPANTPKMKFLSFPGSQCCYSGGGYLLLQILLEAITTKPFAQLMHDIVLEPLGMTRSNYGDLSPSESNFAGAHATAHVPGTQWGRGYFNFTELAAAGLWTTPTDLLKATMAIQNSLHTSTGFLSTHTARAMITPVSPNDEYLSTTMGWCADEFFFAHSGDNDPGYMTYVIGAKGFDNSTSSLYPMPKSEWLPQSHPLGQMSLAIMTNSSCAADTMQKLILAIFAMKAWPLYRSLPCGFGKMASTVPYPAPNGVFTGPAWRHMCGTWRSAEHRRVEQLTYEIYEDAGVPYVLFGDVEKPMKLIPGCVPWQPIGDENGQICYVVDGLEVAFRTRWEGGREKRKIMEVMQEETLELVEVDLKRAGR